MPGKQNDVKITIVAKNGGSTVSPSEGNNDASNINANSGNVPPTDLGDVNVNSNVSLDNVASNSNSSKVKNAIGMITAAMVSTFTEQAKYQYNKYINLSENYLAENTVNMATNIIGAGVGIIGSALSGFYIAGPVGAVLGGSFFVLNKAIKMGEIQEQQQITLNTMNYNREYSAIRLGLIDSRNTQN